MPGIETWSADRRRGPRQRRNLAGWRTGHRWGERTYGAVRGKILVCTDNCRSSGCADCTGRIAVAGVTFGI